MPESVRFPWWKVVRALAPAVLFWAALVGWLAYLLSERTDLGPEADEASVHEWIDEARAFRKTLPELVREYDSIDIADGGGIPLDIIQKYINFHYSVSLDLFGSETSTNAANYFTVGLKGRWQEERRTDDHQLTNDSAQLHGPNAEGTWRTDEISALLALIDAGAVLGDTSINSRARGPSARALARVKTTYYGIASKTL